MDEDTADVGILRKANSHELTGAVVGCEVKRMEDSLAEGQRVGRYVILRDVDGKRHAIAAGAVAALGETDDGALILLPGGRMIHVPQPMHTVVRWLSG